VLGCARGGLWCGCGEEAGVLERGRLQGRLEMHRPAICQEMYEHILQPEATHGSTGFGTLQPNYVYSFRILDGLLAAATYPLPKVFSSRNIKLTMTMLRFLVVA
jgi:hypothetical protein